MFDCRSAAAQTTAPGVRSARQPSRRSPGDPMPTPTLVPQTRAAALAAPPASARCRRLLAEPRRASSARKKPLKHPHSRRHGLHRAGAGRVRDRARARGHADQSQQDAARLLQGTRRTADRRPERRHERAQGPQVRRRDRQPDDAAGVGAQRRAVHEGQHEATTSSSRRSPPTPATRSKRGRTKAIRLTPMPEGLDPYTL